MIVFGNSLSPFVRKVIVFGDEKGIALELQPSGAPAAYTPEFLAASPLRKMPALVDGDFSISDSTAIITYLEAKHPTPPMIPIDAKGRARAIWFEEFADTELSKVVFKVFFNRIVAPVFMKRPGDEAQAIEGETKDLPPLLQYLEKVAPSAGGFLVGNALSVGDIAVTSMFINFDHAGVKIDAGRYPRVTAWVGSMLARPSFAKWIAAERKMLGR